MPVSHHATTRTARVRGMAFWQPRATTLALLDTVRSIRGGRRFAAASAADTSRIRRGRARRGGYVEFDAIRDDGANIQTKMGWDSAADLIATWRNDVANFRLDREQNQPHRLLVVVEAAGMAPMVAALTAPYSIPVIASGGFDSTTAKYRLAVTLGEYDGLTEILHIGDHDPSGVHMFTAIVEDVEQFIADLGLPGAVLFTRLAVTPEQVAALGLPTMPPKVGDNRSFQGETTQAEAIPPDALARIVTTAVTDRLDHAAYSAVLARETRIRAGLADTLDRLLGGTDNDHHGDDT